MNILRHITIGQYVPGNSYIHRLDPRTKCIVTFLFIIFIFLANNICSFVIAIIFTGAAVFFSNISFRFIWRGLKTIWLIIIITFLFQLWFIQGGELIVGWGPLNIYEEGLLQAGTLSVRIVLLVLSTSLLTLTSKPLDITDGMERLLKHLKKVKFPVHEFALMVSIALRFIPTLLQETEKIMKAQAARGAQFHTGHILKRMKHFVPVFIPLFISSLQRAEDLALAMDARAYRGGEGRTQFRQLSYSKIDVLAFMMAGLTFSMLLLVRSW